MVTEIYRHDVNQKGKKKQKTSGSSKRARSWIVSNSNRFELDRTRIYLKHLIFSIIKINWRLILINYLLTTVRVRSFPGIENWSENSEIFEIENSENSEFKKK